MALNLIKIIDKSERKDNDGNVMVGKSGTPLFNITWGDTDGNAIADAVPFSAGGGTYYNRNDMTDAEVKDGQANNFSRLMGDSRREDGTRKPGKLAQACKALDRVKAQFNPNTYKWTEEQAVKVIQKLELELDAIKAAAFNISAEEDEEFITL